MGDDEAADGLEPVALDVDAEALGGRVDVDLGAEHEDAVPFLDDGVALDVVFVADLADDLLEHVLDRHEAGRAAVLVDDDRRLDLPALKLAQQLGNALRLRRERRRPHVRGHAIDVGAAVREQQQILHEDDADDVVEVVVEDRDARVALLAELGAQIADGRVVRDGDQIGARRHDLAHQRVAEVDDRSQQARFVAFRLFFRLDGLVGVGAAAQRQLLGRRAFGVAPPDQAEQRQRQRQQRARHDAERRQQELGDDARVGPDDQLRHQVLAGDDEAEDHQRQHRDAPPRADPEQHGCELDRDDEDDAQQDARRDEQQTRLVQVARQRVVGVRPLRAQPLRQPHQRRESGLDGADVDPGNAENEQEERDHTLHHWAGPRSISPAGRPPCRRSRRSIRAMRPESCS
jgi:hypothetical protein